MVKVIYLAILRNETKEIVELAVATALGSYNYFKRKTISEFATEFSKKVAQNTGPGQRQKVDLEKEDKTGEGIPLMIHAYGRSEGICGICITDKEYPALPAQALLSKICDEFVSKYPRSAYTKLYKEDTNTLPMPELDDYIQKYQDPSQADNLTKIQRELDETTQIMHKTIESMLERGQKIDDLVAKSDGLSAQSKLFYTQAKKQNSCCIVM
ncbi:snare protein-like protein ykt6 [Lentithecium fluviatile CBS 122367]|uniref:Synaptobrevin homolog YKT6 n=1 Tax=Lentithecium fluviatile CBS 122367 TaxID=1168545 RepID=A0A6G1J9C2_9PLEO|nr:snare protein-like protein ykt6 [Lentithecium fluviatile CBS 122367]